jgi:hypothetical protein
VFHPDMRKPAFKPLAAGLLVACLGFAVAMPATASATISEVGLIAKTEPETVPSCTTGPIGSAGKKIEEEKTKAEEEAKKKTEEEAKKKREAEKAKREEEAKKKKPTKKTTATKASAARATVVVAHGSRSTIGFTGGTGTFSSALSTPAIATAAATTTPETTTEEETKTAATTEAPCLAISRTTGFQTKVGAVNNPLVIPHNGRIVAWTIDLGRPTTTQTKFFDENEGGVAQAGIGILQPDKSPALTYKLIAESPVVKIQPYFGLNVQLGLEKTLKVKAGDVVALTVPTWAPSLALGFEKTTSWRASRESKACSVTNTETAQAELKSTATYSCQYLTARLAYSATEISTP